VPSITVQDLSFKLTSHPFQPWKESCSEVYNVRVMVEQGDRRASSFLWAGKHGISLRVLSTVKIVCVFFTFGRVLLAAVLGVVVRWKLSWRGIGRSHMRGAQGAGARGLGSWVRTWLLWIGRWVGPGSRASRHVTPPFRFFRKAAVHSLSNLDAISPEMNGARVRRRREDKRRGALSLSLLDRANEGASFWIVLMCGDRANEWDLIIQLSPSQ
jgi:hypothetical protein